MTKFESLVHLIHSMSRAEKKKFSVQAACRKSRPDYMTLYDIIEAGQGDSFETLRQAFREACPATAFDSSVTYLFELLLDQALDLRIEQDRHYLLFNKILKARVLFEKSLFDECFDLLRYVMDKAGKLENYHALLLAGRLELEYLLALNFPRLSEDELLKKQFKLNETLKHLRKINEQSGLYEILKHRLLTRGYSRSEEDKRYLNDLVYSEISIVANLAPESFEISKLHQLFQSEYLISVGDYKSALRSYYELSNLFEAHKHLWNTPPLFYLLTIEGVLESLRSIHNYAGMGYFIQKLKEIGNSPLDFKTHVLCTIYLYELFPSLDCGDFAASAALMETYKDTLYARMSSLNPARQAELCLYTSLIYFGTEQYNKAHRFLSQIIFRGKTYYYLPLYRTIRIVNLMILYHLSDHELISYECRSLRRELSGVEEGYKIERFMFHFLQKLLPAQAGKRLQLWHKYEPEIEAIRKDIFEQQVLRIFDFTAWVESLLTAQPISTLLAAKTKH